MPVGRPNFASTTFANGGKAAIIRRKLHHFGQAAPLWARDHQKRYGHSFNRSTPLEFTHQISSRQAVPNSYLTCFGSKQNTIFSSSFFGLPDANEERRGWRSRCHALGNTGIAHSRRRGQSGRRFPRVRRSPRPALQPSSQRDLGGTLDGAHGVEDGRRMLDGRLRKP